MEVPRPRPRLDFAAYWRLRCAVHNDPQMNGGTKATWDYLYIKAGGLTDTKVSSEEVAAAEGRDGKQGYDYLLNLEARGYIAIIDRPKHRGALRRSGPWHICLNDPVEIARMRLAPQGDGQGVLFDGQDAFEERADDPQILPIADHSGLEGHGTSLRSPAEFSQPVPREDHPPDSAAFSVRKTPLPKTSETSEEESLSKTSDLGRLRDLGDLQEPTVGNLTAASGVFRTENADDERIAAAREAIGHIEPTEDGAYLADRMASEARRLTARTAKPSGPFAIGDAFLRRIVGGVAPVDQAKEAERLLAWVQKRVDDPRLRIKPCLPVVWAVVRGEYPVEQLARVCAQVDIHDRNGTLHKPRDQGGRAVCFLGIVKRSMAEHDRSLR